MQYPTFKKLNPYTVLLSLMAFISSCQPNYQPKPWDHATIDSSIATNAVYSQLDIEKEIFSMHEKHDSSGKRTSGVLYFTKAHVNLSDSNAARFNNCRAYSHGDTLSINIGIGSGLGAYGFVINYKDKQFYTTPYYVTDLIIPNKPEPVYQLVYQKLTLDKSAYKVGDSLFGNIDFKLFEIGEDKTKMEHAGKGYFRTKVSQAK